MLKSTKGEMSAGLIIGIVVILAVIVGLIIWSQSKKSDIMAPETENVMMDDAAYPAGTTPAMNEDGTTTTTTTTTIETVVNPSLPQTGMGPDEK